MKAQWFNQVQQIGKVRWQQAIGETKYPFAQYAFHAALEDSGSVGGETGWYPEYILLMEDDDTPVAIVPTYLKTHSQGEFVFDWSWADAYQRYGYPYFPKRIWAVPFSPVTGPRIFTALDPQGNSMELLGLYATVGDLLTQRTQQQTMSSWHLLFTKSHVKQAFVDDPILSRVSCQFHWFNRDYRDMEHYLEHFSSRKRKSARKERQKVVQQGIRLQRKLGVELTEDDLSFFYLCYQSTYAKRGQYGYLTREFFQQLVQTMGEQVVLVLAYHDDQAVAASWCFFDDQSLYGRYWGCLQEFDCLHFEACYYQGIEFCLEKGLQHFDPGTQGEHKIARGFEPVYSHSLHYIDNEGFREAIEAFCKEEAQSVVLYHQETTNLLPFKTA
ncbi:GNAT family N-acetyltransferase [Marinomonas algicola]|jgi:uncharacterized protein|uniref:GNAT family N-acetyltransferase n=1 Tax=Marinomonas algicola TaxID=2773454 RepID=UPI001749A2AB|nr:GNAT family N-acetyltransferase [Marinomonas algicola]